MKISIIGAGNVGGLTAMHLCSLGFHEIVLIDTVANIACAKALDLNDARFIFKQNYHTLGTDDIAQIEGSKIIIITAGIPRKPGMKREELVQKNSQIIKEICRNIKHLQPHPVVVVVTNPLDVMTYLVIEETHFTPRQVLGMGLTLDSARLANLIAEKINVDISQIEPCVIGSHGEEMLPLSRYTKVKGLPLDRYLKQEEINELFRRTVGRGAEIVAQSGSGSSYFAPSTAISELIKVIVRDERRTLPVSAYLNGEYGLKDLCIGLPCCLGKYGIENVVELELNEDEKSSFLKSAESIRKQISAIYV